MKPFYIGLLTTIVLTSATSSTAGVVTKSGKTGFVTESVNNPTDITNYFKTKISKSATNKASKATTTSDRVLTYVSGESKEYELTASSLYYYYGYIFDEIDGGMIGNFVFNESNHSVYLKDPIPYLITDTYAVGSYTDNSITITTPQAIYREDGYTYYLHRMVRDEENSTAYLPKYVCDDSVPVTFTIADDGTISWSEDNNKVILGMTDADGNWTGYGNYDMTYSPFDKQLLTTDNIPADAFDNLRMWSTTTDSGTSYVKAGELDGKFYIEGINITTPDNIVEGTIEGNVVTIPSRQYIGRLDEYNFYLYFAGLSVKGIGDDAYYEADDCVTFDYDREAGTLTCRNDAFAIVSGIIDDPNALRVFYIFNNPTLSLIPSDISLQPKAAYNLELVTDDYESFLNFTFDGENEDGIMLDFDKLYYRIYFDDEVFVLTPNDYYSLTSDLTDIGFDQIVYDDYGMADIYYFQGERYIYFYFEAENPGVQTVFKDGEKEYCSKIVYADQSAVHNIAADKTIISVSYTDLSGRAVKRPTSGLYLRTIRYSDGSQSTEKFFFQ